MLPPSGATHRLLTTVNFKLFNPNVSESLVIILDAPPITHLHTALTLEPIHEFIYRLMVKFFYSCPTHSNPLVRERGNYTLPDLQTVQKTDKASPAVTFHLAAAVFFSLRLFFTAETSMCRVLTDMTTCSENVNWL
jgi:hypothetical protein